MTSTASVTLPASLDALPVLREDADGWTSGAVGSMPVLAMTAQSVTLAVPSAYGIGAGEQQLLH
ncbi:hypothetical protein FNQ90_23530 [Streptomyces alkaliphilus]|uniref:Uncharacterized protein n=1 Tax=Streptomyces alkaliphilus TaxID=1472722 RepID=A0A7W3TI26_9ACTN|nr:hypothetical protein [Streptomyces alkaliphilus]MBB0247010.1 hypothetical protein [Streptomyces alkaliphilus]